MLLCKILRVRKCFPLNWILVITFIDSNLSVLSCIPGIISCHACLVFAFLLSVLMELSFFHYESNICHLTRCFLV